MAIRIFLAIHVALWSWAFASEPQSQCEGGQCPTSSGVLSLQMKEQKAAADPETWINTWWNKVHEDLPNHNSRVPRDAFVGVCELSSGFDSGTNRDALETYCHGLFDAGLAMMLPSQKQDLGKHCFGYTLLLAQEFYGDPGPADLLGFDADADDETNKRLEDVRAGGSSDWKAVKKDNNGRVTYQAFQDYFLNKFGHDLLLSSDAETDFRSFLPTVFAAALDMMLGTKKTLGSHCFRYAGVLVHEYYFPDAPVMDRLGIFEDVNPRAVINHWWKKAHEKSADSNSRVNLDTFLGTCTEFYGKELDGTMAGALKQYCQSLFEAGTGMMLPRVKTDLGKHCFGYILLVAKEFYGADGPEDSLGFGTQSQASDLLIGVRDGASVDWVSVGKDGEGRVTNEAFKSYFIGLYKGRFAGKADESFVGYLQKVFDASLNMMLPAEKDTLGPHCFRYASLLVHEFYFPDRSIKDQLGIEFH